jgi:hypothetical protein
MVGPGSNIHTLFTHYCTATDERNKEVRAMTRVRNEIQSTDTPNTKDMPEPHELSLIQASVEHVTLMKHDAVLTGVNLSGSSSPRPV